MCFFLPVGKPPWKTSSCACAVLLPEPSQARRPALLSLRDKSCQQLWAKRRGYNSSSVIPNKCPDEVGWRAGSTACFCHSALQPVLGKVSWRSSGGGTRGLQRGARHLDACAERRQGPAPGELEQRRDAPTLQVQPCSSVAVGGLSTPTTDPWIKHAVVFNYYLICCSVFLKRNLSIGF